MPVLYPAILSLLAGAAIGSTACANVPVPSRANSQRDNESNWVTTDDYPPASLKAREAGAIIVSYYINAQGRIENCRVYKSTGFPALDAQTCRLVTRRGKYTPALDQAGNPIPGGSKTFRFVWRLPDDVDIQ